MTRFNLLVISDDPVFGRKALKAVSKSYRKNFIFEVENQLEARKVLERLHVDMILVDLDYQNIKLGSLTNDFENVPVLGSTSGRYGTPTQKGTATILEREGFEVELAAFIKAKKKGKKAPGIVSKTLRRRISETSSFDNYATLLSA